MDPGGGDATLVTMRLLRAFNNAVLAAGFSLASGMAWADDARLDDLFDRLARPDLRNWELVEQEINMLWSRSGSATADYLLRRGVAAMEEGDFDAAYNHLTALTDHAPEFAEGWNARATLFFQSQRFGPAIADIQRTLALEPRHYGALMGLGIMLEEMGEYARALEAFRMAEAIHPHRQEISGAIERIERELDGIAL